MTDWHSIENGVVSALVGLDVSGSPVLATVRARTHRDRRGLLAELSRERFPAAYVMVTGRASTTGAAREPGAPDVTLWLASRSARQEEDARRGADDVTGAFELAARAAIALQELAIEPDRRLSLDGEGLLAADGGLVVWEQRYSARRQAESAVPLFGDVALTGAASSVRVEVGPARRATSSFSFPGLDGVFQRDLGSRGRTIHWRGLLRAVDDAALNAIEAGIEKARREAREEMMTDAWGREYALCVLTSFQRRGPRRRDELTGAVVQDVEMEFVQLEG